MRHVERHDLALWDVSSGKQLRALEGHSNVAYNVAFSADGTRLTSGARTVWDLRTGQGLRVVPGEERIYGFPTADGKLLAVITPNASAVRVVETATGRTLHQNFVDLANTGHVLPPLIGAHGLDETLQPG